MLKQLKIWLISFLVFVATTWLFFGIFNYFDIPNNPMWLVLGTLMAFGYIFLSYHRLLRNRQPKIQQKISDNMLAHYQAAGMSNEEINFFRETMQLAEGQVKEVATNLQALPKLRAIDLNHDTVKTTQALFKSIVKEPQKLHNASDFLYRHLPSLTELSRKFIEISQHDVKTADTYAVLDKSAEAIAALSQQIQTDYTEFVADDLEDLDTEVSVANQQLTKEQNDDRND